MEWSNFQQILVMRLAGATPLILGLLVGLLICFQQYQRRPRAAVWLGIAMGTQLLWTLVGWPIYFTAVRYFELDRIQIGDGPETQLVVRVMMNSVVPALASTFVWGCAFCGVLLNHDSRRLNAVDTDD